MNFISENAEIEKARGGKKDEIQTRTFLPK
jgi:hypothetical protein